MIHETLLDMEYSHLTPPTLPVAKVQAPTRTDSGNISVSPKILSMIVFFIFVCADEGHWR